MNCMVLWRRMTKYVRTDEICSAGFTDNLYFPGEEYDISEAEQAELDEKLNEIKEDISEDDKIADDVEKMIQQQVNVRQKAKENIFKNLIFKEFPSLHAEHDQGLEGLAQELLQLLRADRPRHGHHKQGRQGYED